MNLLRLRLKRFAGKVNDWQEFCGGFNNAIHEDTELANVDKVKNLKSFVKEPASKVIAGIPLTDTNCNITVDLLQKRYGRASILIRAPMNGQVNLQPVFNKKSKGRFRQLHNQIETQFRGMEALKVNKKSYSSVVVLVLMDKVPEIITQNMLCISKDQIEWTVDQTIRL